MIEERVRGRVEGVAEVRGKEARLDVLVNLETGYVQDAKAEADPARANP